MYNSIGIGAGSTTTGVAGVTLLPNTGGFRFMFVFSVIALAIGVSILLVTSFVAIKKRSQTAKK
ncbi:MAG TPA: hypothetical protein VMR18_00180 [Candidatus Saccharimonadales bacterium]|jgi:hypothetical protein|nr:hypothetical protein [Candidatus Saccharimonadales bacterium]